MLEVSTGYPTTLTACSGTEKHNISSSSVQTGIYALGKPHMRSSTSLRPFPSVGFERAPVIEGVKITFSTSQRRFPSVGFERAPVIEGVKITFSRPLEGGRHPEASRRNGMTVQLVLKTQQAPSNRITGYPVTQLQQSGTEEQGTPSPGCSN